MQTFGLFLAKTLHLYAWIIISKFCYCSENELLILYIVFKLTAAYLLMRLFYVHKYFVCILKCLKHTNIQ